MRCATDFATRSTRSADSFSALEQTEIEPVPLFVARALPYGVIEAGAFSELVATMLEELQSAEALDGLLVAPHGATVSESHAGCRRPLAHSSA